MTISGALSHVKKAFTYIESIAESDRSLYNSTKRSIAEMISICGDIIEIGNDLIGEETCVKRGQPTRDSQAINDRLDRLEKMISNLQSASEPPSEGVPCTDSKITQRTESPSKEKKGTSKLRAITSKKSERTKYQKKKIADWSDDVDYMLQKLDEQDEDTKTVCYAVGMWYRARILHLDTNKCSFRYHISNIPDYVLSIVMDYEAAHDKLEWKDEFYSWIERVKQNDPAVASYALPYRIYERYNCMRKGELLTNDITGLIWDSAFHAGLFTFCSSDLGKYNATTVYRLLEAAKSKKSL